MSVVVESKEVILDKAYEYLSWLTQPHESFSNMAVCPFIEPEIKREVLYIDIWYPSEKSFMHCMEDFYHSGKNSALFVCPNTDTIDWEQVERKKIQAQITKMLKNTPMFQNTNLYVSHLGKTSLLAEESILVEKVLTL